MSCLVIGEALVDEIEGRDGQIRRIPGGSMLNVAIGLRRLGRTVRLVTDIGIDADGAMLTEYAASNGLELWLRPDVDRTAPTSVARAKVDSEGIADYDLDFTWDIQSTPVSGACKLDLEVLAPHSVAVGSFSCNIEPGASKVRDWVKELHSTATIFYDPNVRPSILHDLKRTRQEVEEFVQIADVVKVSRSDLRSLYGNEIDVEAKVKEWMAAGPALIVLTTGSEGAIMCSSSGYVLSIAAPMVDVVDTVGAGAAFFSALIDGVSRISLDGAKFREDLRSISLTNLQTLGAYAATAASITVSRSGANPPTRDELIDRNEFYQTSGINALSRS